MKRRKKQSLAAILGLTVLTAFVVVVLQYYQTKAVQSSVAETTPVLVTQRPTQEPTTAVEETTNSHEGEMRSYLTGDYVTENIGNRRPVAVMFNNSQSAVPQTGIKYSGVIYEAPCEGGITRLMGIMENYDGLDKIGSVRSARPYYSYLSQEYQAIYAHYGQSKYTLPILERLNDLNGVLGIGNYYRTTDRVSPNNAYGSGEGFNKAIASLGYTSSYSDGYTGNFTFSYDTEVTLDEGIPANTVKPGYATNKPYFTYNSDDALYYRYQYGDVHYDDIDGSQLTCKNIILEYCNYTYYDEKYLNIDVLSSGSGKYITNGKAIDITWSKDGEFGKTTYCDMNGNEIKLNTGVTWICIVLTDSLSSVVISE